MSGRLALVRPEHVASGTFLLMTAAFAMAPVRGQSPSPDASPVDAPSAAASGEPSVAPTAQPSLPPGGVAPLPARIVEGGCAVKI